jgi:branched-chain amino acid transport system ATP-binding protein
VSAATSAAGTPLLTVADLHRAFGGVPAVAGVSFTVSAGEVVGLIGPNGSGKSTTVNMVSGALSCDDGRISLLGSDITNQSPHKVAGLGLARTFQIPRVWAKLTVAENLLVAGTATSDETAFRAVFRRGHLRRRQEAIEARMREVLAVVHLTELAEQPAETLSGGQKRLLEFGRIIMSGARVLVLDEPFAGVNPTLCRELQGVIEKLRAEGCAVLIVEHNLQAVEESCGRVLVMATGKLIAQGPLAEVRSHEEVISAYLGRAS